MPLILYKWVLWNHSKPKWASALRPALPSDIMVFRQYLSDKNLNSVASEQSGRARRRAWTHAAGKQAGTRSRWKLLHLTGFSVFCYPGSSLFAALRPRRLFSGASPLTKCFIITLMLLSSLSSTFSHPTLNLLVLISQSALSGEETAGSLSEPTSQIWLR